MKELAAICQLKEVKMKKVPKTFQAIFRVRWVRAENCREAWIGGVLVMVWAIVYPLH